MWHIVGTQYMLTLLLWHYYYQHWKTLNILQFKIYICLTQALLQWTLTGWPIFNLPQILNDIIERYVVWMFKWVNFLKIKFWLFLWQWFLSQFLYLWKSFLNSKLLLYLFWLNEFLRSIMGQWVPASSGERASGNTHDCFGYDMLSPVQL